MYRRKSFAAAEVTTKNIQGAGGAKIKILHPEVLHQVKNGITDRIKRMTYAAAEGRRNEVDQDKAKNQKIDHSYHRSDRWIPATRDLIIPKRYKKRPKEISTVKNQGTNSAKLAGAPEIPKKAKSSDTIAAITIPLS